MGELLRGAADDLRHVPVGGGAGEAHAEDAGGAAAHLGDVRGRGLDVREDLGGALDQQASGVGQVDAAGGAVEEARVQLRLQLPDLLGEGRLGHVESLRGAAEVALLGDGEEVPQVSQFHGPPRPSDASPSTSD